MRKKAMSMINMDCAWQPDNTAPQCSGRRCGARFGILHGHSRHHCRFCGRVFCGNCAPMLPLVNGTPTLNTNFTSARRCNWCRLPKVFVAYRHTPTGKMDGTVIDTIFSFLDNKSINAYLQSCTAAMHQFHVPNVRAFASLQDRFPSLFQGAQVGKGGCGTVFKVEDRVRDGLKVAVKVVHKSSIFSWATWRKLLAEISIMKDNEHINVSSLLEVLQTPTELVMVIELGEGGSLKRAYDVVRKGGHNVEVFTAHVVSQVAAGLDYLHTNRGIVHRDIKHDNIVLSKDYSRVMIIDFGLAELVTGEQGAYVPCGTMGFASPENILAAVERRMRFKADPKTIFASDLFSLGVVAFAMLSTKRPLRGTKFHEQWKEVSRGLRCTGPAWAGVSLEAKELVERLLHASAEYRATPADVAAHRWIRERAPLFQAVETIRKVELEREESDEEREWIFVAGRGQGHESEWGMVGENGSSASGRCSTPGGGNNNNGSGSNHGGSRDQHQGTSPVTASPTSPPNNKNRAHSRTPSGSTAAPSSAPQQQPPQSQHANALTVSGRGGCSNGGDGTPNSATPRSRGGSYRSVTATDQQAQGDEDLL